MSNICKKRYEECIRCHQPFTSDNVITKAGWRETQISGMCEKCFDAICAEPDEEEAQPK